MKRRITFLMLFLLLINLVTAASAEVFRVYDGAYLLYDYEAASLEEELDQIYKDLQVDVVVVTVDSLYGESAMAYADDFYDYSGYGEDGVLLLLAMDEREYWISTSGSCISKISVSKIEDAILSDLSAGYYYDAFTTFAQQCRKAMNSTTTETGVSLTTAILACLGIGLVIALITVFIMKSKLKTVRPQSGADGYACYDKLQITRQSDMFLYHTTTRVARMNNNNSRGGGSHFGSSGRSHGGGGGRF